MSSIFNEFEETYGSNIWPSTDPNDSPFNEFKCKHCGEVLSLQMCGESYIGDTPFEDLAKDALREQLMNHCSAEFLKSIRRSMPQEVIDCLILREIANTE